MKNLWKLIIFFLFISMGVFAYAWKEKQPDPLIQMESEPVTVHVTVHDLYTNPKRYDGKRVIVKGYYYEAFEKMVLIPSIVADTTTGYRLPSSEQIWVNWNIRTPPEFYTRLVRLPGIGEPDYFGKVEVEGTLYIANMRAGEGDEAQLGSGHLGEYKYTFTIEKVSVFDEVTKQYVPLPMQ